MLPTTKAKKFKEQVSKNTGFLWAKFNLLEQDFVYLSKEAPIISEALQ